MIRFSTCLFIACLKVPASAQKPGSNSVGPAIRSEDVPALLPKPVKSDLGYVAKGWKRRDEDARRFAEREAEANVNVPDRARRVLLDAKSRGIGTLSRRETLACLIALHSQPKLPYPDTITPAVLKRADLWSGDYSTTEYKWRTFAQMMWYPNSDLLPAFDRLAKDSPGDWRVQMVRIGLLLRLDRGLQALEVARRIAKTYPDHLGTQVVLARVLRDNAVRTQRRALLDEATRVLDRAKTLSGNAFDRRAYESERGKNDFRRSYGLRKD